ncbi:MAG: hypothetical protein U1F08_03645 [Steroidobacteraceae bacterium]
MLQLSDRWGPRLRSQPETGMGYQVVSVVLVSGRRYEQVLVEAGVITLVRGHASIPFREDEIADIVVTHDRWDFSAGG